MHGPELERKELRCLRIRLPGRAGLHQRAVWGILHGRQDRLWCSLRRPDFRSEELRGVRDCLPDRTSLQWRAMQCQLYQQSQVLQWAVPGPFCRYNKLWGLRGFLSIRHDVPEWNMHIDNYGSSSANLDWPLANSYVW